MNSLKTWAGMVLGAALLAACGGESNQAISPEEAERLAAEMLAEDMADEAEDAADAEDGENLGAEDLGAEESGSGEEMAGGYDGVGAPKGAARAAGSAMTQGLLRFEPAVVVDASGFERPMAASTVFIPFGWQAAGGVLWGQEFMCTNGYNFNWSAVSSDGLERIAILPQAKWEWSNYGAPVSAPGCQSAPYTNIQQFLEAAVEGMQPGARIEGIRVRDDLQREFSAYNQSTPMPMGESRTWVEAAEIAYRFNAGGREMKGTMAAVAVFSLLRSDPGSGMGVMDNLTGFVFPAYGASAPAERFNPALYEAIRRSIKTNPEWQKRITGHNVGIARAALEESRKRADMINRSNEEIARIRNEAWANYQESADRRAREFGELMKGVETYADADAPGGQVELSQNYNHAWRLEDGTYVLSNDANFDPWRDLRVEGRRLGAVE